jgi:thiamine monophosphate kinase
VTGSVGGAAAGLAILQSGADRTALDDESAACVARYERPIARLRCGRMVAAGAPRRPAWTCLTALPTRSGRSRRPAETGAEIDGTTIPLQSGAASWLARGGVDPIEAGARRGRGL